MSWKTTFGSKVTEVISMREYYRADYGNKIFDLGTGSISYDSMMSTFVTDADSLMDRELYEDEQHMRDWLNDCIKK